MVKPIKFFSAFLAVASASVGCVGTALKAEEPASAPEGLRFEFPIPLPGRKETRYPVPLWTAAISESGKLSVAGEPISQWKFRSKVRSTDTSEADKIGIKPSAQTSVERVTTILAKLPDTGVFEFVGNEKYRMIDRAQTEDGRVMRAPYFQGELGEYELPVSVTYLEESEQCLIAYDEFTVSGRELYDRSFDRLERIIMRSGGVEAVLENEEITESIVARVQVEPETPWRCVAGALYHVQASGWPFFQIELVDQTSN